MLPEVDSDGLALLGQFHIVMWLKNDYDWQILD